MRNTYQRNSQLIYEQERSIDRKYCLNTLVIALLTRVASIEVHQ